MRVGYGSCIAMVLAAANAAVASTTENSSEVQQIRVDRASAVAPDGVFTDRVHVRVRSGADIKNVLAPGASGGSLEAAGDAWSKLIRKWNVRLVWPTFDPAPANAELARSLGMDRLITLWVPEGTDVRALAREASELVDLVEAADVDSTATAHVTPPNDTQFGAQWHLNNTGQVVGGTPGVPGADTRILNAWGLAATAYTFTPITVAILDTGVSQSHPDLQNILVPGQNTVSPSTPLAFDDNTSISHGTYCAGIAGAIQNNQLGGAGISPNVRIMPVKVLQSISLGSQSACANGLRWAVDNGARVASMSLGWGTLSRTAGLDLAVTYADQSNVVVCSSSGNAPGAAINVPAKLPESLAVGGSTNRDEAWPGGTTGVELDLVAPSSGVLTTSDDASGINGFSVQDGTSMACPMVSGAAAIVLGINPALTSAQVRSILLSTADDLGAPGLDPTFGHGRLNVERAMRSALASLPCRTDVDLSGTVNIDDLFVYLSLFFAGDPRADINGSLSVNLDDLFTFIAMWFGSTC